MKWFVIGLQMKLGLQKVMKALQRYKNMVTLKGSIYNAIIAEIIRWNELLRGLSPSLL